MLKKSLKIFSIATLCITFACKSKEPEPYLLSSVPEIRALERQDHKFCTSLDLNSGTTNKNFNGDLYWHCRLSMAKYKLKTHVGSSSSVNYNANITDLVTKISLHLSEVHESVFVKENKKLDARDDKKCVAMGYNFSIYDRTKTDQYLLCRKRLLDEDQLDPAFGIEEYLQYPNRSYNMTFILDNRIDSEIKRYEEAEKNYPYCLKFFNEEDHFKQCVAAQDNSRQCLTEIVAKKFKKESEKKTICQKQAYVKFPDAFLKDADQKKLDIQRAKTNADVYNQNSFGALGIDKEDIELFESEETADAEYNKREQQKKAEKNINSKKGLYSRNELIRLRQRYIGACQQNADGDVQKYVEELKKECSDIGQYKPAEKLI